MTQHNAALVEETNAAIEQTDNQVNILDQIVEVFKLELSAEEIAKKQEIVRKSKDYSLHNRRAEDKTKPGQRQVAPPEQSYPTQGNAALAAEWE